LKFEQVLQIYWSKGFLYGGRIVSFQSNLQSFCTEVGGLGVITKNHLLKRFELHLLYHNPLTSFDVVDRDTRKLINILLSQITSVNHQVSEIQYYNLIRLYLIKCRRGKAQALGHPSRGQRTWSNSWTSYHYNKTIRTFITTVQRVLNKDKKEEKINYKVKKRILSKSTKSSSVKKVVKPTNMWF